MPSPLTFRITARSRSCAARVGRVETLHGGFDTPAFMPVGTRGTVKGILPDLVANTGAQVVLANTYHLLLRPGPETVERLGGLHPFMHWNGPILTDSGGYQAYSMADINTVTDDGVIFKSVIDGSTVALSPERATHVQNQLGADIIMAFDDCPPSVDPGASPVNQTRLRHAAQRDARAANPAKGYDHALRLRTANERTLRWLERCNRTHRELGGDQVRSLFGIVQGGADLDQRSWCAERVCALDLPGFAIGGVAVGEQFDDIARVVRHTAPLLPDAKPRYLMGVGYERDLLAAVRAGLDMFDCVLPTRNGRNANAFTPSGQIRLRNAKFAEDPLPIEPGCDCAACSPAPVPLNLSGTQRPPGRDTPFTRAYIRHLFSAGEMLGPILVTLHNLRYFQRFMTDLRGTIASDDWAAFLERWPVASESGNRDPEEGLREGRGTP